MSTFKARKAAANRGGISHAKLLSTSALTAAGMIALTASPALAVDDYADWDGISIVSGSASVTDTGLGSTNIDQHTLQAVGEAQELHIGTMGHVNIDQQSSGALFVARVVGDHSDPTQILGMLTADGRVMILDRNGVLFGANSKVDVAGIAVSTGDVSNADIMDGDDSFTFENFGSGSIQLEGTINVAEAGLAAFVSPAVVNNGYINAKLGTVAFAAGEKVTLDLYGDGLVEIALDGELADALLENKGTISAEGGNVIMTAQAAKDAVDNIINVEGVVTVASATQKGGKIVLSGGDQGAVAVSGTLDATGTSGGEIEVTGQYVQANAGANIDASGTEGDGGTVHFGGGWQGGGGIPASEYSYVDQNAILRANAGEDGDGGEVVVWSDKATSFNGSIEAKGGSNSGNGGNVEVSSLGFFGFTGVVDTTAANGETGTLLLDPRDVTIRGGTNDGDDDDSGSPDDGILNPGGFVAYATNLSEGSGSFDIYESEIEAQSSTTNIIIQARRNITTVAEGGGGADNTVNLANNRNLTIETSNQPQGGEADNDGIIDLSNLGFATSGTGSINITGSTGSGESIITTGNLTSKNGNINIATNNGGINLNGNVTVSGTGALSAIAEDDITTGSGTTISLNGGALTFTAGDDILIDNKLYTKGGAASFTAGGDFRIDNSDDLISTVGSDAPVTILASELDLGGYIFAGSNVVTIGRSSAGTIDVGDDNNGGMHIDQGEVSKIFAGSLVIGNSLTTNVTVDNVEMYAQFKQQDDQLPTPSQGCENSSGNNPNCAQNFETQDTNLTLKATSLVDIIGPVTMGTGLVTVDAPELDLNAKIQGRATPQAAATNLGDSRLIGTAQLATIDVLSPSALINQAINFADDATALTTINIAAGTYNESVLANEANIKLQGAPGFVATIDPNSPGVHITANDVIVSGLVINTGDDGILVDNADKANINNNKFTNQTSSAVRVINGSDDATIGLNTITGTGTSHGVIIVGGSDHDVNGNNITGGVTGINVSGTTNTDIGNNTVSNTLSHGIVVSSNTGGTVTSNTLNSTDGDGIIITSQNGLTVSGNKVNGADGNGISVGSSKNITLSSNIIDNTDDVGIEVNNGVGTTTIDANTITNTDDHAIEVSNTAGLTVSNNLIGQTGAAGSIKGDGIHIADSPAGKITGNKIANFINNGIYVDPSPSTLVDSNIIVGGLNGIVITDNSDDSTVTNNTVSGQSVNGILVNGGSDDVLVGVNNVTVNNGAVGIRIDGGDDHDVQVNTVNGGTWGILLNGTGKNNAVVGNTVGFTTGSSDNGIYIFGNTGSTNVSGNHVHNAGWDGIQVNAGTGFVDIYNNDIHNTKGASGIAVLFHKGDAKVDNNFIENSARLGIYIGQSNGLEINKNTVNNSGTANINGPFGAFKDGILVEDGDNTTISNNNVNGATGDGIRVGGGGNWAGVTNTGITISGNTVLNTGDDGIDVVSSPSVQVTGNFVGNTGAAGNIKGNGIEITNSASSNIASNTVANIVGDGIYLDPSDNSVIKNNILDYVSGNSIVVDASDNVQVTGNKIGQTSGGVFPGGSGDGIQVRNGSDNALVQNNNIKTDGRGVSIFGGDAHDVDNNTIQTVDWVNASDEGIYAENTTNIDITKNHLTPSIGNTGIYVVGGSNADILDNDVHSASGYGIGLQGVAKALVNNNLVDGATNGVNAFGGSNITITNNDIYNVTNGVNASGVGGFITIDNNDIDADTSKNNPGKPGTGIYVTFSNNVQIGDGNFTGNEGNNIDDFASGIYVNGNTGFTTIDANDITDANDGITAVNTVALKIIDNNVDGRSGAGRGTGNGILVDNSTSALVGGPTDGNTVTDFDVTGIQLLNSDGSTVANNTVSNITNNGIHNNSSDNTTINNNSVTNTGTGILVNPSFNVDVISNVITTADYGVKLENSTDILVQSNTISGIDFDGVNVTNNGGDLEILTNSIAADIHGIHFTDAVGGGDDVDIHDNVISGDNNNNGSGDGIRFSSTVNDATVNIGNGSGATVNGDASNVISGVDGIHFEGAVGNGAVIVIDGNRIGYGGSVAAPNTAANTRVTDDGIQFGVVNGNADIDIVDNFIRSVDDGVNFLGNVTDNANILIGGAGDRNTIDAQGDGIQFSAGVTGQALIKIVNNLITAVNDGVLFTGGTSNALDPANSEEEILIADNDITGGQNGVRFTGPVSGERHDIRITNNKIDGQNQHGIAFGSTIDDAEVRIHDNISIVGDDDGINVAGQVKNSALVEIIDNTWIEGEDDDAINFASDIVSGSVVRINSNDDIHADDGADNGIEFSGVNSATVEILNNNNGIYADTHGIYFGAGINGTADIDIHDNNIWADQNNGGIGDGVHFAGTISGDATINIGDGSGASVGTDYSNVITGVDGIHFAQNVTGNVTVVIDGNRIGYEEIKGKLQNARVNDDGIQFAGDVNSNAEVTITDNWIRAEDDGVSFQGLITNLASILIGGDTDGNNIDANADGVQFEDEVTGSSLIEISYNTINADDDGILFNDDTSNADLVSPFRDDEILIAYNDIVGGNNGISFLGRASGERHDIRIENNSRIRGNGGNGINHTGGIDNAQLWILDNPDIFGSVDGVHIFGAFFNDAYILVDDNTVDSGSGDGIEVTDTGLTGGSDVNITDNHVHNNGDNGIEVANVDDVLVEGNEVHNTNNNGIYVSNSDGADILDNLIYDTGNHGILVNPSDFVDIAFNEIHDTGADGIHVDNGNFADIWDNHVGDTGDDGIDVNNNDNVEIWDNYVHDTDGNGIEVSDSFNADIIDNLVEFADEDGIEVTDSNFADIRWNEVRWSGDDGIDVHSSDDVDVVDNHVHGASNNGIEVTDSDDADINLNEVHFTGDDGIYAENIDGGNVNFNDVNATGDDGIDVRDSNGVDIIGNDIWDTDGDGIQVRNSNFADINWNDIWFAGDDGIDFEDGAFAEIENNDIFFSDANGIEVEDSAFVSIADNDVHFSDAAGIFVDPSAFISVTGNHLTNNFIGVHFDDVFFSQIANNTIEDNFIGVYLEGSAFIDVSENTISDNFWYGLWADGGNNGYINVENNVFLDNPVHARFESGIIDLTGVGNQFYNGQIGLEFDAWNNQTWRLSLVRDGGFFAGGYTYDGQFNDTFPSVAVPTNFGGTIGNQYFEGQTEYFVALRSNTFMDLRNQEAIWLNGQDSTYYFPAEGGAFTPSIDGLTPDRLAFLELMFRHYPDVNNRGIFFFGLLDNLTIENFEDFFREYEEYANGPSGLNITLTGLPPLNLGGTGGGPSTFSLANIEPAAGGETSAEDLADIEPAAGAADNDASCWADAANLAGSGTPVNYSYGGGFEESIADAAGCGAESF